MKSVNTIRITHIEITQNKYYLVGSSYTTRQQIHVCMITEHYIQSFTLLLAVYFTSVYIAYVT